MIELGESVEVFIFGEGFVPAIVVAVGADANGAPGFEALMLDGKTIWQRIDQSDDVRTWKKRDPS
jgi:hypothetical protein